MKKNVISLFLSLLICYMAWAQKDPDMSEYNVVWDTQCKNASESMPCGGRNIALNVWTTKDELVLYIGSPDSWVDGDIPGEVANVKIGRIRLNISPNPFANSKNFRRELNNGCAEIEASGSDRAPFKAKLIFWVEVFQPVIHLSIEAEKQVEANVAYENWLFKDRELKDVFHAERFGALTLESYPGKVIKLKDSLAFDNNGVLF